MSGFSTRNVLLDVSGQPFRLRVLAGLQPLGGPDGHAASPGDHIGALHHRREAA